MENSTEETFLTKMNVWRKENPKKFWIIVVILLAFIGNATEKPNNVSNSSATRSNSSTTDQNTVAVGGSGCESSIERKFRQVNKLTSMIGYIGNGQYAVQYEEMDGVGGSRTAKVTVDSNCNIIQSE